MPERVAAPLSALEDPADELQEQEVSEEVEPRQPATKATQPKPSGLHVWNTQSNTNFELLSQLLNSEKDSTSSLFGFVKKVKLREANLPY